MIIRVDEQIIRSVFYTITWFPPGDGKHENPTFPLWLGWLIAAMEFPLQKAEHLAHKKNVKIYNLQDVIKNLNIRL